MAQQREAILIDTERVSEDTRLMSFRMTDGELGFVGGQYVIVDTGITIAGNKIAKRAYSILSADAEQREFRLAVRRIGDGPGSNFMHRLERGSELRFSGPWGRFVGTGIQQKRLLVFATDTGITAALGLLHGQAVSSSRSCAKFIWFTESDQYFLPFHTVMGLLEAVGIKNLAFTAAPPVSDSARVKRAIGLVDQSVKDVKPNAVFLSGDGAVIYAMQDKLLQIGVCAEDIHLECFFNNPQRKAAA